MEGKKMKFAICLFEREDKQYLSIAENNSGEREHEIFHGSVDQ
jgi:hypothetical protein